MGPSSIYKWGEVTGDGKVGGGRRSGVRVNDYKMPSPYNDGYSYEDGSMWMDEEMGGNWMNISSFKQYIFPSGRVKPSSLTQLRLADHRRAVNYIKRCRRMGLLPYMRVQAKMYSDPAAIRPSRDMIYNAGSVAREASR